MATFDEDALDLLRVTPGKKFRLKDRDTSWALTKKLRDLGKEAVKEKAHELLTQSLHELTEAQDLLYADNRYAVLVVLQGMDAAGKDGTVKHVMSGVNPQGCQVFSFKQPSTEELDHTFLWRYQKSMPERGRIGIFNRSYYEDVLVVKVHPELVKRSQLPHRKVNKSFWEDRYDDINAFERHLTRNGTVIIKFFLHMSKSEQRRRFLERLENPEKHWKYSPSDVAERSYWDDYQSAFEDALEATSTKWAPWYVIPADQKWATRALIAATLSHTIRSLDLHYPEVSEADRKNFEVARQNLLAEED